MSLPLTCNLNNAVIRAIVAAFLPPLVWLGTVEANEETRVAESLRVSPETIRLGGLNRQQQLMITAVSVSDEPFDVTHQCQFAVADTKIARIDGTTIAGVADGRTRLQITYGKVTTSVTVDVVDFATYPPVHFVNDVIPLFSKLACNSGGCHGKQSGQNGFKLSVFGFDPQADYNALVKHGRGRRVSPARPLHSLLVSKPTGRIPHGGGRRTEPGSTDEALLLAWIRQGMPWGDEKAPTLKRIIVEPTDRVMRMSSDQQILVTAVYSDGSRRDVTAAASYNSNANHVAKADEEGRVRVGKLPGEAAVTVSYMSRVGVARFLIPRPNAPQPYPKLVANNRIDELVWAKLKSLGVIPSPECDDASFLRRLYLDAIGTLPTRDEARKFLADDRPDKRRRAIDAVLQRPEFADYWALKWADVLLVDQQKLGARGAYELHRWLRTQIARNRPYDEWVRELVTATGNSGKYGPVNFYRALRTPEELTRGVSQAFLGIRMDCAQCHHHPFDQWGQEDFYGLAGFFNGVERKKLGETRELVFHAGFRETKIPISGQVAATRPPAGKTPDGLTDRDPRIALADWLTSPKNSWFARLAANRLWKHFLGRGLVEPEDDLRWTNPATNEPLLAYLADRVVAQGFDLKAVTREILNSRVYQLSSEPNATNFDDTQNYSHYLVKRLPAEVLLDAVSQVTGSPEKFPGMPEGTRAIQLWDNRMPSYFLDTFGRSPRESPCACGKSDDPTMAQALHLMNAPEIDAKIADPRGGIAKLVAAGLPDDQIVEELCLSALGRQPGAKEKRIAQKLFASSAQQQAAEDFLWTLMNSYEFLFIR